MDHSLNPDNNSPTPATVLAEQIFQQLVQEGLLSSEENQLPFVRKLAQGELRDSDWSVALNPSLQTQKTAENENSET